MAPPPSVSHFPPAPAPRDCCSHFTGSVAATPFPTLPASRHLRTMHPHSPQMSLSLGRSVASTPALIAAVNTTYLLQPLVLQTVDLHPVPMFGQARRGGLHHLRGIGEGTGEVGLGAYRREINVPHVPRVCC